MSTHYLTDSASAYGSGTPATPPAKTFPVFLVVDSDQSSLDHTSNMIMAQFPHGKVLKFTKAEAAVRFLKVDCFKFWSSQRLGNVIRKYCLPEFDCKFSAGELWNTVQKFEGKLEGEVLKAMDTNYKPTDVNIVIWDMDVNECCPFEFSAMLKAAQYPHDMGLVATYSGPDPGIESELNAAGIEYMRKPVIPFYVETILEDFLPSELYKRRRPRYY